MSYSPYNSVNEQRQLDLLSWLKSTAPPFTQILTIETDAGTRRYFRVFCGNSTMVAVDADPKHEDSKAFIDIASRLQKSGLRTPEIYHYNLEKGFLLIEDLGKTHMQNWLAANTHSRVSMYELACDCIIEMQQRTCTDRLPSFSRQWILQELHIFEEWFIKRHLGYPLNRTNSIVLSAVTEILADTCEEQPQAFMHRDFHCRNLMVKGHDKPAIIDFQGAMLGPISYDLGSLLKDAYILTPKPLENTLCEYHRQSLEISVTAQQFERWYRLTALQRHLKILGLFCRLNYRDGKPQYLSHIDLVANYVIDTLGQYGEFSKFKVLFKQLFDHQRQKKAQ